MTTSTAPQTDRRAEIIDAAIRAFSRKGFGGSTLADIAAEAGVSQPRISQVFGNKENAFIAAHRRASEQVLELLNANVNPDEPYSMASLGAGYRDMLEDRSEVLLMIFQALTSSYVPAIGQESRRVINEIVEIVQRAGGTADDARNFLERGFFIHAMLASGALCHADDLPPVDEMLQTIELR
ncbi:TetR/AcrR family transcriptional regulator [Granulicoccus sp. GXG6511]|uniref:TetR/AcrR family transcriptional regulator n=1 Tax=Granulicoccus sp. GXG6511 TaxID=3381351 RepID=UPI003D7D6699